MELPRLAEPHSANAQPAVDTAASQTESLAASPTEASGVQDNDLHSRKITQTPGNSSSIRILPEVVQASLKQTRDLVWAERINFLLIFVPVGIAVGLLNVDPIVIFVLNALAIIPLAVVISTATECLASRLGDTLGALLNVTVGNAAELTIFFVALSKGQLKIVQASLLGSTLANLLVVLGTAFLAGGLRFESQLQDRPAARMSVGFLDFGLLVSIFPVAFLAASKNADAANVKSGILAISRGTSIGLILAYVYYLIFQMRTQSNTQEVDDEADQMAFNSFPLSVLHRTSSGNSAPSSKDTYRKGPNHTHRRPNLEKLRSGMSRTRWLKWASSLNGREPQRKIGLSNGDGAERSLLRRVNSFDNALDAPTQYQDLESTDHHRSRSLGARPVLQQRSSDTMVSRMLQQRSSLSNLNEDTADTDSESGQDRIAMTGALPSALPPSPPSTIPSPSRFGQTTAQSHTFSPEQHELESDSDIDLEYLDPPDLPAHGSMDFYRRSTLHDLYEHRRHQREKSRPSLPVAIIILMVSTGIVAISTELAVDAIPPIVRSWRISQIFLGFIILPVVGNAAEHVTAMKLALNNKM